MVEPSRFGEHKWMPEKLEEIKWGEWKQVGPTLLNWTRIVTEGEKCKIQMPVQTFLLFVISAACEHLSIVLSSVLHTDI